MTRPIDNQLRVGPYSYRIRSSLSEVAEAVNTLYSSFPATCPEAFLDFDVAIVPHGRARAVFQFDHRDHFAAVERRHAHATLEWGMNWCVSVHCNEYLKLHAAVVSNGEGALLLPGIPGAGKSTLCALLALNGWRVLSDEHALITPGTTEVTPIYRPISLKNESITLVRGLQPDAVFGPVATDTHKGTVAHLKADAHPQTFDTTPVPVRAIVFPRYAAEESQKLSRRSKTSSFLVAAFHAFNYSLLGSDGFRSMQTLIDAVPCFDLVYRDVDWALGAIDYIVSEEPSAAA
jgi:HprK-related kinase A